MTRKRPTEEDRALWAAYARTIRKTGGSEIAVPPEPPPPPAPRLREPAPPPLRARPATLDIGNHPAGLDASTWRKLRGGKLTPARTLDLHGMTLPRAHAALASFLAAAKADGIRCVEVITGQGAAGRGAIRREFALWLNQPEFRDFILGAAHPHAANPGAVRLLLRRPK